MSLADDPVFPLEIEEIIFSLAVQTDWNSAKNFILVAKRVYEGLIPQIYKVRVFHVSTILSSRPPSDSRNLIHHGRYVHHIMLYNADPRSTYLYNRPGECLGWCPNALDVALWITNDQYDKNLVDQLLNRHLTHLSFDLDSFERFLRSTPELSPPPSPISFVHLTHLEVISVPYDAKAELFKTRFPALTHLALNASVGHLVELTTEILKVYKDQLKVLIWYKGESRNPYPTILPKSQYLHIPPDDSRVVVLSYGYGYVRTWYEGTIGGLGLWRVAEEFIANGRADDQN